MESTESEKGEFTAEMRRTRSSGNFVKSHICALLTDSSTGSLNVIFAQAVISLLSAAPWVDTRFRGYDGFGGFRSCQARLIHNRYSQRDEEKGGSAEVK
jgi:hypothetical protein